MLKKLIRAKRRGERTTIRTRRKRIKVWQNLKMQRLSMRRRWRVSLSDLVRKIIKLK